MLEFTSNGFSVFGFHIAWYGLIIACAVMLAIWLCLRECKRVGIDPDKFIDLALIVIPLAIVGARLYYVAFEWDSFRGDLMRIIDLRSGGLAIYGAVIAGMLGVVIFSKWRKISFWRVVDVIVPSLILAQGIGRWGNFFNQEAYGYAVMNPSLQWFPFAVYIEADAAWHLATFFYEFAWCMLGFVILSFYQRRSKRSGNVFAAYLVVYGFERMLVEGLRTDSLWWGNFRVSQVLSALMFVGGVTYLIVRFVKDKKTAQKEIAAEPVSQELKIIPGYQPSQEEDALREESDAHLPDGEDTQAQEASKETPERDI